MGEAEFDPVEAEIRHSETGLADVHQEVGDELVPRPPQPRSRPRADVTPTDLFTGTDPRAILARLADGDPLRLYEGCARRIRERFLLVDLDRLFERSLAMTALAGASQDDDVRTPDWIRTRIDTAVDWILREDRERERASFQPTVHETEYAYLTDAFGVEPASARSASVSFNGLPERIRKVFFRLLIEACPVEDCVAELGPSDSILKDLREALRALGHLDDWELEAPRGGTQP